jgi:hypothetical protein
MGRTEEAQGQQEGELLIVRICCCNPLNLPTSIACTDVDDVYIPTRHTRVQQQVSL